MANFSKEDADKIFEIFMRENPNPVTELNYLNHYTLLVAIVLSAQTTDVAVNKATKSLFEIADTPEKMITLGEENIKNHIKTIGLYNSKAKNIILLSEMLINKYKGKIPKTREDLEMLPGVGRKTANVFLNCAFGEPVIAVDTHVFRVANRIGLVKSKNVLQTELQLMQVIPDKWKKNAHHWLILHGRYKCKAKKPQCTFCKIKDFCNYQNL